MTEEEAKQRWCPFARLGDQPGCNRWPTPAENSFSRALCIASACMAWRMKTRVETRHKYTGQVVPPDAWRVRGDYEDVAVPDGGYCGLAGAPQ